MQLEKHVLGYPMRRHGGEFVFETFLTQYIPGTIELHSTLCIPGIIDRYSNGKSALVVQ